MAKGVPEVQQGALALLALVTADDCALIWQERRIACASASAPSGSALDILLQPLEKRRDRRSGRT